MLNKPRSFNASEILAMIQEEIDLILEEKGLPARRLHPGDRLSVDLSLKSLDLARLVASLEVLTGVDPFQELVSITSVRCIGDLQAAYQRSFMGAGSAEEEDDEIVESQRRAQSRRDGSGRVEV